MKIFSLVDIISPQITLYYKDELMHPSMFSGILSIICYILMTICGFYYLLIFFRKENPTAFFFNRYVEEAGNFPLNSSSMFGFIQFINTIENRIVDIDFDSARLIGIEKSIDTYTSNTDLTNYDHWIYGKCNNDTDTKGIGNLINFTDYFQGACIRKYYNKNDGKYYETNDENFIWPTLEHGCSNPKMTFYGVIVEKCKNDSLRVNLEKKFCKSDSEINEYMAHIIIQFQIINHFADVLNYDEPFTKYFHSITNGLFSETYTTNNLNFNPAIMKTHKGILFEKIENKYAYFFDQIEKITASTGKTGIYNAFYFWMQNSMQYYERKYQLLQDALSYVGGITRLILSVASIINYIISRYVTLIDSEELFISLNDEYFKEKISNKNVVENQIKKDISDSNPPKKFNIQKYYNNTFSNSNYLGKDKTIYSRSSRGSVDILYNYRNNMEKIDKMEQNKDFFYNKNNYSKGNNYIYYERKERNKIKIKEKKNPFYGRENNNLKNEIDNSNKYMKLKDKINELEIVKGKNKNELNFRKFLYYIICCCKNNKMMSYIEELRFKILSEETVVRSYLNLKEMNKLSEFVK